MTAQSVTILSGIVLLLVFVLVAWNLRRRRSPEPEHRRSDHGCH